jgi:SAM-dependent methyltransferase
MVLSAGDAFRRPPAALAASSHAVIWHDLECGSYRADMPLWRELAERVGGEILDVGAGTGRVALELARSGHSVTALDIDRALLEALAERARAIVGGTVQTVCADARAFDLKRRDFGLCIAPMQTIQLLGGPAERVAFLRCARAHVRRDGLVACAILSTIEPFDCADGQLGPVPDRVCIDGTTYLSRPTRVGLRGRGVLIERERRLMPTARAVKGVAASADRGARAAGTRDVIELQRVSAGELEHEAMQAGLRPQPAREIEPTEDHVGSVVVMLRA